MRQRDGNLWFDMSKHTVCILYTEQVRSVIHLHIAHIRKGRSRISQLFCFSSQQSSRNVLTFPFFCAAERWKFLDLFSISPCDEETEISQPFSIFLYVGEVEKNLNFFPFFRATERWKFLYFFQSLNSFLFKIL